MSEANVSSILKRNWDEIGEPKLLPDGSWALKCKGASVKPPKSEKGNPVAIFTYEPTEPMSDVQQGALDAMGDKYNYSDNRVYARFWLGDGNDFHRLRTHLVKHGISLDGMSIEESLKEVRGTEVVAYVTTETITGKGGDSRPENVLSNFVPADEAMAA